MDLDEYHLVFLRRPDNPRAFSEAELDELQAAHLAYLDALGERGRSPRLATASPSTELPTDRRLTLHEPVVFR